MNILIDYDKKENVIRASTEESDFSSLRGIFSYIKLVDGTLVSKKQIDIPVQNVNIDYIYNKMIKIFVDKFSCKIILSKSAEEIMQKSVNEAEEFKEFSIKAKNIRDNRIEKQEFASFCECLANTEFKRKLKSYQLLAAYHLTFSQNACNFSVPGSGKTTTVLAAYEYLKYAKDVRKQVDKLVIVGPLSAFIAWKIEYAECFGKEPHVIEIRSGVNRELVEKSIISSHSDCDMLIVSYGSVCNYYDIISFFLSHNRCMLVLDEAHRIKKVGDEAQSNYVLSLASSAKSRVVLTGTPAANSYVDLYNLFKFIWPCNNIIGYSVAQLANMSKNDDDNRKNDLIERISPFFIRVKKSDLCLPKAIFNPPIEVEMSSVQRKIYDSIEEVVINKYETNNYPDSIKKCAAIRLRQAASNPGLLIKPLRDDFVNYEEDVSSPEICEDDIEISGDIIKSILSYKQTEVPNKFRIAKDISQRIINDGGNVIIWCEFIVTCEDLSLFFDTSGIPNRILYGKCAQDEREKTIKEFIDVNNNEFNVIIANPHAVGESISLHTTCHNAIYLEQGFNAGVYMQSKDRIHRVGLKDTDTTNYFYIQSKDSVDKVVYDRVLEKESKMLELIESQEIPLLSRNMNYEEDSQDDIRAIIEDYYARKNRNI